MNKASHPAWTIGIQSLKDVQTYPDKKHSTALIQHVQYEYAAFIRINAAYKGWIKTVQSNSTYKYRSSIYVLNSFRPSIQPYNASFLSLSS